MTTLHKRELLGICCPGRTAPSVEENRAMIPVGRASFIAPTNNALCTDWVDGWHGLYGPKSWWRSEWYNSWVKFGGFLIPAFCTRNIVSRQRNTAEQNTALNLERVPRSCGWRSLVPKFSVAEVLPDT